MLGAGRRLRRDDANGVLILKTYAPYGPPAAVGIGAIVLPCFEWATNLGESWCDEKLAIAWEVECLIAPDEECCGDGDGIGAGAAYDAQGCRIGA